MDDQLEDGKLEIELDFKIELEETHHEMVLLEKNQLAECIQVDQVAQPPGPVAPTDERTHKIHAPQLEHDTSLRDFGTWRRKWEDYCTLEGVAKAPPRPQIAALRMVLTPIMLQIAEMALLRSEGEQSTEDLLEAIQRDIRKKRNVALDQLEF